MTDFQTIANSTCPRYGMREYSFAIDSEIRGLKAKIVWWESFSPTSLSQKRDTKTIIKYLKTRLLRTKLFIKEEYIVIHQVSST